MRYPSHQLRYFLRKYSHCRHCIRRLCNSGPDEDRQGTHQVRNPQCVQIPHVALLVLNIVDADWAKHGISGRGVLLDMIKHYTKNGAKLPYDPWTTHSFSVADLEAVAKEEGVEFKQGDILLIRAGFTQRYYSSSQEEKIKIASDSKYETL